MLNRRILRVKAFKTIYGYGIDSTKSLQDVLSNLDESCESVRDLYLFLLAIIPPLAKEAAARIDSAKMKFNPTEEDLNPNMKFAQNALASYFENDVDFVKLVQKKKLSWSQYDIIVRNIYDSVASSDYFAKYMSSGTSSLAEDCRLMETIFKKEFVDNESLEEMLQSDCLFWSEELAYALGACCDTLRDMAKGGRWSLPPLYLSDMMIKKKGFDAGIESDSVFVHKLVSAAYSGYPKYVEMIKELTPDWDSDRLFSTDTAIIILGVAEAVTFPSIPLRVTLNEYVEISKFYCSPKSRQFINGLLDRIIQKMVADGAINKSISNVN